MRAHRDHVARAVVERQPIVRLRADESNPILDLIGTSQRAEALDLAVPIGAARTSDHQQDGLPIQRGDELIEGRDRKIDPLEPLDAAHEHHHGFVP